MPDLLTAKDVEVRAFKKVSFGGYAIPEVEEFLNQVADDIETYALRLEESERRIQELEDLVQKQESMTDMIKDFISIHGNKFPIISSVDVVCIVISL